MNLSYKETRRYKEVLSEINNSFDIRHSGGRSSQFAIGDVAFIVVERADTFQFRFEILFY